MSPQRNVLLVTNATTDKEIDLIKEALTPERQESLKIKLSLVHVIPNLPTCYFNIPSTVLLAEKYYQEAEKHLHAIGKTLGVIQKDQWLINGRIKTEVIRLANKLKAQFILASSTNIPELHKALPPRKEGGTRLIQSINNLSNL